MPSIFLLFEQKGLYQLSYAYSTTVCWMCNGQIMDKKKKNCPYSRHVLRSRGTIGQEAVSEGLYLISLSELGYSLDKKIPEL